MPQPNDGHAAIRAAAKLAVKKNKAVNRNSWSPLSNSAAIANQQRSAVAVLLASQHQAAATPVMAAVRGPTGTILVAKPLKLEKTNSAMA